MDELAMESLASFLGSALTRALKSVFTSPNQGETANVVQQSIAGRAKSVTSMAWYCWGACVKRAPQHTAPIFLDRPKPLSGVRLDRAISESIRVRSVLSLVDWICVLM